MQNSVSASVPGSMPKTEDRDEQDRPDHLVHGAARRMMMRRASQ